MIVKILKWREFNPRLDVRKPSWFRLENRMVEDPDFYSLTHEEFKAWIYFLSIASQKNSDTVAVNYQHAEKVCQITPAGIDGLIEKLESLPDCPVAVTRTGRERDANVTPTIRPRTLRDETRRDETNRGGSKNEGAFAAPPRLIAIWNEHCGQLPKARGCAASRRRAAEARWRERPDPDYWTQVVQKIAATPFCCGQNGRGWRAGIDFLLRPETQHKVMEGAYDSGSQNRIAWDEVNFDVK